jgi:hypothetical protein
LSFKLILLLFDINAEWRRRILGFEASDHSRSPAQAGTRREIAHETGTFFYSDVGADLHVATGNAVAGQAAAI